MPANVSVQVTVDARCVIELTEDEAKALCAFAGYGIDAFLRVFYKELGQAYLKPHESGIRSLFKAIQSQVPDSFKEADECREYLYQSRRQKEKRT